MDITKDGPSSRTNQGLLAPAHPERIKYLISSYWKIRNAYPVLTPSTDSPTSEEFLLFYRRRVMRNCIRYDHMALKKLRELENLSIFELQYMKLFVGDMHREFVDYEFYMFKKQVLKEFYG